MAIVLFFVAAVVSLASFIFWGYLQSIVALFDNAQANAAAAQFLNMIKLFDGFGVFLLATMAIVIIITAAMIRTHPIYVVPAIVLMVIHIIIAGAFSNLYWGVVTATPELTAAAENFPLTLFVFQHLPKFTLVISVLAIIAAYGKIPGIPLAGTSSSSGEI